MKSPTFASQVLGWASLAFALSVQIVLVAILLSAAVKYGRDASNRSSKRWTRFQSLVLTAGIICDLGELFAAVDNLIILLWMPDDLATRASCSYVTLGSPMLVAHSAMQSFGQVLLQSSVFTYFLIIMDRYYVFGLFIRGIVRDGTLVVLHIFRFQVAHREQITSSSSQSEPFFTCSHLSNILLST
ncbi:hypothetical protein BJ742DRAFT_367129 [Cladochytrium replicatum]|nr:hypothetical protein BJ742DRAFT_367129 [Cladochytrium replicatum]